MSLDRRTAGTVALVLSEMAGVGTVALLIFYLPLLNLSAPTFAGAWTAERLAVYVLLFAGPLFIFLPLSLALKLGPVWLLGAGSWAMLGYVLLFVDVGGRGEASFFTYLAFLALVFVALQSALSVPLSAIGRRLLPPASYAGQMWRALRQGGLLSLFLVTLLSMSPLGVLNWLNALLVFTIVALTEFFFLARD